MKKFQKNAFLKISVFTEYNLTIGLLIYTYLNITTLMVLNIMWTLPPPLASSLPGTLVKSLMLPGFEPRTSCVPAKHATSRPTRI